MCNDDDPKDDDERINQHEKYNWLKKTKAWGSWVACTHYCLLLDNDLLDEYDGKKS